MIDEQLEDKITDLQKHVTNWAIKHQLWQGCYFVSYLEYSEDEPSANNPCITVLVMGDELHSVMNAPYSKTTDELDEIMDANLCSFDYEDGAIYFYCLDENLIKHYIEYFEWQWISELVKPDYTDLYNELFSYFHKNPDKLHSLTPRQFEVLMSEIFKNQGYKTQLGSGYNDGGVDIRLFKKEGIDTQVTLVQVKRYKASHAIRLEAVSALYGTVVDQKADKGIFVTSSKYLPGVKKFARRNSHILQLADKTDVRNWSGQVAKSIRDNQKSILSLDYILGLLTLDNDASLVGKIVVTQYGYSIIQNDFFIIIKDTEHASLIMRIPKKVDSNIGYYDGYEVPYLDTSIIEYRNSNHVFRVKKQVDKNGDVAFWGQRKYYSIWNSQPMFFSRFD